MNEWAKFREAREARGLSQAELARLVGISQAAVKKIESGQVQRSRYEEDIKRALGLGDTGTYRPPPQLLGPSMIPVFSAAEGGTGEMVVSSDPISWVMRPWYIGNVKDAYAVVITGESMSPAYEPGDIAIVNPRSPLIRGKNAIFVAGEPRGEFKATIKRYDGATETEWRVHQHKPEKTFALLKSEWRRALRVVGKYEGG